MMEYTVIILYNIFSTSYQIAYRVNIAHSAYQPHARRNSGGKWRTMFVKYNNEPVQ
jgi:hypothetical protein